MWLFMAAQELYKKGRLLFGPSERSEIKFSICSCSSDLVINVIRMALSEMIMLSLLMFVVLMECASAYPIIGCKYISTVFTLRSL